MDYVISGFFNALIVQFKDLEIDLPKLFAEFNSDISILKKSIAKVDANIFGRYLEEVVRLKKNHRVGLESGFLIPFMLTGTFYNLYHSCRTVSELFDKIKLLDSTANNITDYSTKVEGDYLYYEVVVSPEFCERYPVAARQWSEMQFGIALQYSYSYTGRFLRPLSAYTTYKKEGSNDLLEEYLDCPVCFSHEKNGMVFKKSVLNLPVVTAKKELFPIFEDVMSEIEHRLSDNVMSNAVRRYLTHSLSMSTLSLQLVAERFTMSERSLQRKLRAEGTSYQQILDTLRMELAQKYLRKRIPLTEIAFLLGFESQSAFNKFFRKHFGATPSQQR